MFRAFNMGVGMILVVEEANVEKVLATAEGSYLIGEMKEGQREAKLI
jgi:phosphoribosylformylglycinamidine cyclo-ligase